MTLPLIIMAVACVLACYFSACQTVLKTFSRKRLSDLLDDAGKPQRFEVIEKRLPQLMLMTGVLRTLCALVVVLMTVYLVQRQYAENYGLESAIGLVPFGIALLIAGTLLSVVSTAIPGSWARYRNERLLVWSLPILKLLLMIVLPVIHALAIFDPVVRRISGVDLEEDEDDISDHIISAVEDHEEGDAVDEEQKGMIQAIFDLSEHNVGEIMTPRTDVEGIEISATLSEVKTAVIDYGHSRVPVYRENLDEILGILYAKDLITLVADDAPTPSEFDLSKVIREPFLIPESKPVLDTLREMKATKVHLAIVLDEYGGTAGLVTIEDILEEIVGDIQDEYEPEDDDPTVEPIDDTRSKVDARYHVDDLNDKLDLDLPEDEDYDTVGGYVFANLGHIPEAGESFEADGVRVIVDEVERTKVLSITLEKLDAELSSSNGNGKS